MQQTGYLFRYSFEIGFPIPELAEHLRDIHVNPAAFVGRALMRQCYQPMSASATVLWIANEFWANPLRIASSRVRAIRGIGAQIMLLPPNFQFHLRRRLAADFL